jgi:acylglycerol lipase
MNTRLLRSAVGRIWLRLSTLLGAAVLAGCAMDGVPATPLADGPGLRPDVMVTRDGLLLPLYTWPAAADPPRAIVVALHGMNDYGRSFQSLGGFLAQRGITTYAYDQRGFGSAPGRNWWPGSDTLVEDLGTATALLRHAHPGIPLHCLGESMGGAVVILAVTRGAAACDTAILSAPAIWGRQTMSLLERAALDAAASVAPDTVLYGTGLRIRPSDNIAALRALQSDPLVIKGARVDAIAGLADLMTEAFDATARLSGPLLWLHGKNDQIIAPHPTKIALERLPQVPGISIARYPIGYHLLTRDLDAAVISHDIASWIATPTAPLPSGADRR